MYNITARLREVIRESGVRAVCVVTVRTRPPVSPSTKTPIPDVQHDLLLGLRRRFPTGASSGMPRGNSTAHLKCSYVGPRPCSSRDGKPLLGIWQGVYFCGFDGPRHRPLLY